MPKHSEYPSFFYEVGKDDRVLMTLGIQLRCGDRVITIRPCGPGSEQGPDGPFPFIALEDGESVPKRFAVSSKSEFNKIFEDLWGE